MFNCCGVLLVCLGCLLWWWLGRAIVCWVFVVFVVLLMISVVVLFNVGLCVYAVLRG